jgi:hypothetical protein
MSRTTPPATQAPSGTPLDASPHRSAVACAQSSNDPVAARSTPTPETAAAPANPRPATRSHAPVQAFEISDQQQPEVTARRQRRSSHRLRIEALTLAFDELVESVLGQYRVQPPVKGMPGCAARRMRDPESACCRRCFARRPIAMSAVYGPEPWITSTFSLPASRFLPRTIRGRLRSAIGRIAPYSVLG